MEFGHLERILAHRPHLSTPILHPFIIPEYILFQNDPDMKIDENNTFGPVIGGTVLGNRHIS